MGGPYAQRILFFFCRPCGEYHEKTHPHLPRHEAPLKEGYKPAVCWDQPRQKPKRDGRSDGATRRPGAQTQLSGQTV
jgi:hypothetical protein